MIPSGIQDELSLLQVPRTQEPVLFAINTDVLDNRNKSAVVLLGLADPRPEDPQEIAAENTSVRNGSVDFSRRGEALAVRSKSRYASLTFAHVSILPQ